MNRLRCSSVWIGGDENWFCARGERLFAALAGEGVAANDEMHLAPAVGCSEQRGVVGGDHFGRTEEVKAFPIQVSVLKKMVLIYNFMGSKFVWTQ